MTNYLLLIFCILSVFFSVFIISSKNPIHSILYLILVFCNVTFIMIILGVEFIAVIFLIVYVGAIAVLFLFVVMMLNIKVLELDEIFWRYVPIGLVIAVYFLSQIFFFAFKFNVHEAFNFFLYEDYFCLKQLSADFFPYNFSFTITFLNGFSAENPFSTEDFQVSYELFFPRDIFYYFFSFAVFAVNNSYNIAPLFTSLTNTELLGWLIYTYTFFIFLIVSLILLVSMVGSIVLVLNQNINIKRQIIFRQVLKDLKSAVILKK